MVLCKECHDEIHRIKSTESPMTEDDYDDEDGE
jgi:hypothetical protein